MEEQQWQPSPSEQPRERMKRPGTGGHGAGSKAARDDQALRTGSFARKAGIYGRGT